MHPLRKTSHQRFIAMEDCRRSGSAGFGGLERGLHLL